MMQFTAQERRMIAWLRNQHENWPTVRMITFITSCVCAVAAVFEFIIGGRDMLLLMVLAAYGLSYTLGSWHGRPEVSLLLKLIEERQEEKESARLDSGGAAL